MMEHYITVLYLAREQQKEISQDIVKNRYIARQTIRRNEQLRKAVYFRSTKKVAAVIVLLINHIRIHS